MSYLIFVLFFSIPAIVTIMLLGRPDMGIIITSIIGIILLCGSYLSLGIFVSGFTSQPIVAFLVSSVILILNNLMGQETFLTRIPAFLKSICSGLSLNTRVVNFSSGVINLTDLLFFVSFVVVMQLLTVLYLKARGK